jgi:hypothetical protein
MRIVAVARLGPMICCLGVTCLAFMHIEAIHRRAIQDHVTMFEYPRIAGTPILSRRIVLQTRLGTDLDNFIGAEATHQCHLKFRILCESKGLHWKIRKPATGGYNCAGLVWASRRAALPDEKSWKTIINDDGYRRLLGGEQVQIGDVVVYVKKNSNEWLHVARVCESKQIAFSKHDESGNSIPVALSKWDVSSGESIHAVEDVFLNGGEDFEVLFYTDRP